MRVINRYYTHKQVLFNKRINDNLEQQAQALFKSWFVEKPNPQWTKGSLSDIASFVGGYSYKGDELVDSSNTGMATIKNYNRSGGFKTDGFKAINPSDKVKNAQYAELFEILVAHTDLTQNAEVIGNAELVLSLGEYNKIIFSMDLVKVLPSSSFPYRFLIAAMLKNKLFKGHCQGYVNGTTVLHLNKKALPEYKVMIPTDTEAKKMNEILGGYYKRLNSTCKCNRILINNLFKFFVWREVSKSFTRSIIEFIFNPLNLFVGYFTKVLTLWDILPDKPVGVFIGTTFP